MNLTITNFLRLFYSLWAKIYLASRRANVVELEISGELIEHKIGINLFQKYLGKAPAAFGDLIFALEQAETDPRIKACLAKISSNSLGWGRASELREAIHRFRACGKKVFAFLEESGNLEYFIATACDEIILPPSQSLDLIGLLTEVIYFKGVLDKLEIKPEFLQVGKYKSAAEPFTRDSMSEEHREALNAILDDIFHELIQAISQGRNLPSEKVKPLIDQGPYLPEEALEQKLVDRLMYSDQMEEYLESGIGAPVNKINAEIYYRLRANSRIGMSLLKRAPRLALIYATGVIEAGDRDDYQGLDENINAEQMLKTLRALRENPRIKAAVLRIDSPGGNAVSSDLIWREVKLLSQAKPLIVSMADTAASGGYYLAMPGEKILAQPGTITGSIGVLAGKINLRGLYHKIGLNKEQLKRGEDADLFSDYTDLTGTRKAKLTKEIEHFYRLFVEKAAEARKMTREEMDQKAQGRVWTGKQAMEIGLIDGIGGLRKALDLAKQTIGLLPQERALIEIHPRPRRKFFPAFRFRLPTLPFSDEKESRLIAAFARLAREKILLIMPFLVRIK